MFELGHIFLISIKVFPNQPALVAKGITVLPFKSYLAKNDLIVGAGLYHQTGVLRIISS